MQTLLGDVSNHHLHYYEIRALMTTQASNFPKFPAGNRSYLTTNSNLLIYLSLQDQPSALLVSV